MITLLRNDLLSRLALQVDSDLQHLFFWDHWGNNQRNKQQISVSRKRARLTKPQALNPEPTLKHASADRAAMSVLGCQRGEN